MPLIATVGSITNGGGAVLNGNPLVLFNGKPVAIMGFSIVSSHPPAPKDPTHVAPFVTMGSPFIVADGDPIAFVGCMAACGHAISSGQPGMITL